MSRQQNRTHGPKSSVLLGFIMVVSDLMSGLVMEMKQPKFCLIRVEAFRKIFYLSENAAFIGICRRTQSSVLETLMLRITIKKPAFIKNSIFKLYKIRCSLRKCKKTHKTTPDKKYVLERNGI